MPPRRNRKKCHERENRRMTRSRTLQTLQASHHPNERRSASGTFDVTDISDVVECVESPKPDSPNANVETIPRKSSLKRESTYIIEAKIPSLNITHSVESKPQKPQQPFSSNVNAFNVKSNQFMLKPKSKLPLLSKCKSTSSQIKFIGMKRNINAVDLKKSRGISKPNKKPVAPAISKAKAVQMLKVIQSNVPTPNKVVRPAPMPNFGTLHQKQFEKMESIIQNKMRKEERAKKLLTCPITPSSGIKGAVNKEKNAVSVNKRTLMEYNKFGFKLDHHFKMLPTISYADSPSTRSTIQSKAKEQLKMASPSASKPTNGSRIKKHPEIIAGVRTNRQFELRMKARNAI